MSRGLLAKLHWTEPESDPAQMAALAARLEVEDGPADLGHGWPRALWSLLEDAGAPTWSLPEEFGGRSCPRPLLVQRYAKLAGASLTAGFILSQHDAAVRRLLAAPENPAARRWLCEIGAGRALATVGISHLTTSRRLGAQAVRAVMEPYGDYRLDGTIPWVTAAERASLLVTGAVLDDMRQMLIALPADRPGVVVRPSFPLAALEASCTAEVELQAVRVADSDLLCGPAPDVMAQPGAVGTAGLETSALALGQARAALVALVESSSERIDLAEPLEVLCENWQTLWSALIAQARSQENAPSPSQIRTQANALVLRATQAFLTASKGTGFLRTEPAQRWARQALFFLVWSCPTPVAQAAIRDLAGLCQV
jgi:alkylation response protein AidB-like acyl-CoA dehydrogenase